MIKLIIISLILSIVVITIGAIKVAKKRAFKKSILEQRKTKDDVINVMKERFGIQYKDYENIKYDNLEIRSQEGYLLKGYYSEAENKSNKVVIVHHGYKGNHYMCLQYAKIFLDNGFNVLLIDMRSHGESEGEYVTYGYKEKQDLDLWVDLMKKKLGEDAIVGLYGHSMGAATVLMYGGVYAQKIKFIVADCAYSNGKDIVKDEFRKSKVPVFPLYYFLNRDFKRVCGFDMNKISPMKDIISSDVPVLFIHGTLDRLVPYIMSEEMYKKKDGPKDKLLLVEGAYHVGAHCKNTKLYEETIKEFINDVLYK